MKNYEFVHRDTNEHPWGVVTIRQMWEDKYAINYNRPEKLLPLEAWRNLILQAKNKGIECGAKRIGLGNVSKAYDFEKIRQILEELHFVKVAGRVDYKREVDLLVGDEGSPFSWRTAEELNWSEKQIAEFTYQTLRGTLEDDPNDTPEGFITEWLQDDELTCGRQCISIGFLKHEPAAIVVVQIIQKTGESRISWMGALPEYKNLGFGKWIHRRGFHLMKAQGGKLYYGSSHEDNRPMRRLFEGHGCVPYREREVWECLIEGN